jgi:hypothetical protein
MPKDPVPARPDAPDRELALAAALARWTDRRFLDPLIGLFLPGVGDLIGTGLGLYPVYLALRRRAPKVVVARMLVNLGVDMLGGAVPVLGDVWDFVFRANSRNLELLRERAHHGAVHSAPRDWLVVAGAALFFGAALAIPIALVAATLWALTRS